MNEYYSWHSLDARMKKLKETATTLKAEWGPSSTDIFVMNGGVIR